MASSSSASNASSLTALVIAAWSDEPVQYLGCHSHQLTLEANINEAQRKALLKLRVRVGLKGFSKKMAVYMIIEPGHLRSVQRLAGESVPAAVASTWPGKDAITGLRLCFKQPAALVGPPSAKKKSKKKKKNEMTPVTDGDKKTFEALLSLARAPSFTLYFQKSSIPGPRLQTLCSLCDGGQFGTKPEWLAALYAGNSAGTRIEQPRAAEEEEEEEEEGNATSSTDSPPSYDELISPSPPRWRPQQQQQQQQQQQSANKRRREESPSEATAATRVGKAARDESSTFFDSLAQRMDERLRQMDERVQRQLDALRAGCERSLAELRGEVRASVASGVRALEEDVRARLDGVEARVEAGRVRVEKAEARVAGVAERVEEVAEHLREVEEDGDQAYNQVDRLVDVRLEEHIDGAKDALRAAINEEIKWAEDRIRDDINGMKMTLDLK